MRGDEEMESAAARVARGVAFLDERVPDWVERIELRDLDLTDPCFCVIGQVFRDEPEDPLDNGWDWAVEDEHVLDSGETLDMGLDAIDGHQDYILLQREWADVIETRKGQV